MTKDILLVDPGAAEILAAAEEVFNDHILFLRALMEELRETAGSGEKLKLTEYRDMMKELGKSANIAQHERKRLAELRKKKPDLSAVPRSTSTRRGLKFASSWIASLPLGQRTAFLDDLTDGALAALPYLFEFWALEHQLPPKGDWRSWVIMGGRGAGKTRAGAEWVRAQVEGARPLDEGRAKNVALIGETIDQTREVMVFGQSGIMACCPPDRRPEWQATRKRLVWPNGAVAQVFSAHDPEGLRGPQFDAAWVDEFGCAAVDKGTNEPNKFLDPKSSESSLPKYSTGRRDDLIQAEYLRAVTAFWGEDTNNPTSAVYGGPMIDMSKAHVWAWDTRPFPRFSNDTGLWSDGENYSRGHWISGRIGAQSLAGVVAHVCEAAGVADFDVSRLYGTVRGYAVTQGGTARAMLQPLMLAYAFDAIERDGTLIFRSRTGILDKALAKDTLAINAEQQGDVERIRAPEAEVAGRIRLNFAEAESDFSVRAAEVIFPDEAATAVDQSELPLVLTKSEARAIIERWLAESRVARDGLRILLPPSMGDLGAGDVVSLPDGEGTTRYRIDRTETAGLTQVEAVRVERSVYVPSVETEDPVLVAPHVPALPVFAQFLDLPLLKGDEVEHAPHLAVSATPWPGSAAVFSSASGDGFSLNTLVERRAIVGTTLNALAGVTPDIVDRGAALQVQIEGGDLASTGLDDVLNGAGLAAVGDGTAGKWEVFQFTNAVLVGAQTWELSDRLRGQAGTDGMIPASWPPGSVVVFLDGAVGQIDLPASARGLERTYRIGPGDRSFDDASYTESVEAFDGIGLRPYAPTHLKAAAQMSGDVAVTWVRRTRIDGDSWQSVEVPLGEISESYLLRVIQNSSVLREETLSGPQWTYSVSDQTTDGAAAPYDIEVAQQSDAWGPGLFRRITFNG